MIPNPQFWQNRSVFISGHTGFKGGWLSTWLLELGARLEGYGLPPHTTPSYFDRCGLGDRMRSHHADVRDADALQRALALAQPSVVFHLAAQPIVRASYRRPVDTIAINVLGTTHMLEAIRHTPSVQAAVIVTSDKCYENKERGDGYREDDVLGGHDPYSASKAGAELIISAYQRSFFAAKGPWVASVRAGNVIGGGDWAEDRLIPDVIRALARRDTIEIRNPAAVRPWQHVLEPICGYLMLAERLCESERFVGAWNFGPRDDDAVPVATLLDFVTELWPGARWQPVPGDRELHEAGLLRLDWSKARTQLGWTPRLRLRDTVELTLEWYRRAADELQSRALYKVSCSQIDRYTTWSPREKP